MSVSAFLLQQSLQVHVILLLALLQTTISPLENFVLLALHCMLPGVSARNVSLSFFSGFLFSDEIKVSFFGMNVM